MNHIVMLALTPALSMPSASRRILTDCETGSDDGPYCGCDPFCPCCGSCCAPCGGCGSGYVPSGEGWPSACGHPGRGCGCGNA